MLCRNAYTLGRRANIGANLMRVHITKLCDGQILLSGYFVLVQQFADIALLDTQVGSQFLLATLCLNGLLNP